MPVERFEPIGRCYLLERCDWWNPPMDMLFLGDDKNYCIKCWEFKNVTKKM